MMFNRRALGTALAALAWTGSAFFAGCWVAIHQKIDYAPTMESLREVPPPLPGFSDLQSWQLVVREQAAASWTGEASSSACRLRIERSPDESCMPVQLQRTLKSLRAGQHCVLEMKVRALPSREMCCLVTRNYGNWHNVGLVAHRELTNEWQILALSWIAPEDERSAALCLGFGERPGAVEFEYIRFVDAQRLTESVEVSQWNFAAPGEAQWKVLDAPRLGR